MSTAPNTAHSAAIAPTAQTVADPLSDRSEPTDPADPAGHPDLIDRSGQAVRDRP
ncbi:hypothetical protein P1P68_32860 [Streptomyces scabiei]|uniref:hypothetical protein n=1 Tax=Streptomyces scabiei TaxID=1930 RepID=UPI0029A84908|nr:hypothetical protein [Streptomyces scabiei]